MFIYSEEAYFLSTKRGLGLNGDLVQINHHNSSDYNLDFYEASRVLQAQWRYSTLREEKKIGSYNHPDFLNFR